MPNPTKTTRADPMLHWLMAQSRAAARPLALCAALLGAVLAEGCADGPHEALYRADALIAQGDADGAHRLLRASSQKLEAQTTRGKLSSVAELQLRANMLVRLADLNAGPLHNPAQAIADNAKVVQLGAAAPQDSADANLQNQSIAAQCRMADLYRDGVNEPGHAVTTLRAAAAALGTRTAGAQVRQNLVATLMAIGNYNAAHTEAEGIVERWPGSREARGARLTMGRADYMEGRFARAAATLEALTDDSSDKEVRALAQVEAGNCHQELGAAARALEFYYAALAAHPNPSMVQDKIMRVRERIYHIAPKDGILNASRPSRHIAAWQPRPTPQDLGVGGPVLEPPGRP